MLLDHCYTHENDDNDGDDDGCKSENRLVVRIIFIRSVLMFCYIILFNTEGV